MHTGKMEKAKLPAKVDLRRLMQQKKQDSAQRSKIDSPLARYSSGGQLSCVVCRTPVKSELAWTGHLASRSHKERVAALRAQQTAAAKRPAEGGSAGGSLNKRPRGDKSIPDDFFQKPQVPKKGILKNAPRPPAKPAAVPSRIPQPHAAQADEHMDTSDSSVGQSAGDPLVARVQDVGPTPSSSSDSSQQPDTGQLPKGFFDDPQKDAKARHVEYVNPVEAEWERFQREMQTAAAESEVILDEDQQEATFGRQIEEVDEQIRELSRVVSMEKRKEQLASVEAAAATRNEDEDSGADETEVDEFLDWRSKGAWK